MPDKTVTSCFNFELEDESIHKLAVTILLGLESSEIVFIQGEYSYKVKGGEDGHLCYRKGNREWVLVANWCFYGLYIVVRYRKPVWLRPMYRSLFQQMNFTSVTFNDSSIELLGTDGEILRSRRFRLSPPSALSKVMTKKFGYSQEKIEAIRTELNL